MAWADHTDVAHQHLALADDALARASADPAVSADVVETLTQLRAGRGSWDELVGVGVGFDEEPPATR